MHRRLPEADFEKVSIWRPKEVLNKPPYTNNIKTPPHIVMFVADDLGWNDIS
jgi:hypothetical protein